MGKDIFFTKVERWLESYKTILNEIKNLELDIEEIEENYGNISSVSYEEKGGITYNISRPIEKEVLEKEKRVEELLRVKRSKEIKLQRINNSLSVLNDREYKIIELKYFNDRYMSWATISERIEISEAWCRELRDRAIKKIIPVLFVSQKIN